MTIAALEELAEEFGDDFCGVVVCGGGLKRQWFDQIMAFTCEQCCGKDLTDPNHPEHDPAHEHVGASSCISIDGDPAKRMKLYERALAEQPRYVIVGYDQVVDDHNMVLKLPQMFVVADEVTTIKNPTAGITEAFRAAFSEAPFRYGLTGTPMENGKPEEMFQLMVWIDGSVLGRPDLFDQTFVKRNKYGTVKEYVNLPLFYEMMRDCSVSIDPDDVGVREFMPKMRPPKRVLIEFDAESARVYQRMSDDLITELLEAAKQNKGSFDLFAHYAGDSAAGEAQGKIMSKISCMRMLCAHPDVLIGSAEDYLAALAIRQADPAAWPTVQKIKGGKKVRVPKPLPGSAYAAQLLEEGELDGLDETPKTDEVSFDIEQILRGECWCCRDIDGAATSKVVVFSYHKKVLRILQDRLGHELAVRYDGDMSLKVRDLNKKQFQRDAATRIFLTSDAGGYGVDLPQANHLLNLDKPFTAGRVTQRNARVRRANLDYHDRVHVRDYLMLNTLEVYYADVTASKQLVVDAVRNGRSGGKGIKVNAATLSAFLKTNAA